MKRMTPDSFAHRLEEHRPAIARYLRRILRRADEADDLVQETFVRAVRRLDTLEDDGAFRGWLFQIATNLALDRLRQRNRQLAREAGEQPEEGTLRDTAAASAQLVMEQTEMSACVRRHLAHLSDAHRAMLLLCDVEQLPAREIAELLGLPLTTVKMRIHRARRNLRTALAGACTFEQDGRGVLVCGPRD